jgi:solute carrier family 15 oligopeptide transporter 1
LIGIFIRSFGTGAIKSCVTTFGADQFQLPNQSKHLTCFFSFFYLAMVAGSLIGSFLIPILRTDVKCLGSNDCFPLAFGIPTVFMFLSVVVFLMGNLFYKKSVVRENAFLKVCGYYWVSVPQWFFRPF